MNPSPMSVAKYRAEALVRTIFAGAGRNHPATEWTRHRGGPHNRERHRLWITHDGRRDHFDCTEVDLSGEAGFRLMEPRLRHWLEEELRLGMSGIGRGSRARVSSRERLAGEAFAKSG